MKKLFGLIVFIPILVLSCGIFTACELGKKKLEFYVNGELYKTIKTSGNEKIILPNIPTNSQQIFDGWYFEDTSVELTSETYVTTELTANKKIIANMVDLFVFDRDNYEIIKLTNRAKELVVNLSIPSSIDGVPVKKIGNNAFSWNKQLLSINLAKSIEWIGEEAFYECENIRSITIPASVREICEGAFSGLRKTTKLIFESNSQLKSIGDSAFCGLKNIESVKIPKSVEEIGGNAFYKCTNLNEFIFEETPMIKNIGRQVFGRTKIKHMHLPSSLISLGSYLFDSCDLLEYVIIPNSVKTIGSYLFLDTEKVKVYCENNYPLSTWDSNWAETAIYGISKTVDIYWGESWSLVEGVPTLN